MKRLLFSGVVMSLAFAFASQQFTLGSKVTDFTLSDLDGNPVKFSGIKGDNLTVLLFSATQCPIDNDYQERKNVLYADYTPRGVKFIGINSNHTEPAAEVREHSARWGFQFKVYKDHNNVVADRFAASVTPEVIVLDRNGVVRYRGHIDDSRNPANIKFQGLRAALDGLLAGQEVARTETKAFGCTIKRVKKET